MFSRHWNGLQRHDHTFKGMAMCSKAWEGLTCKVWEVWPCIQRCGNMFKGVGMPYMQGMRKGCKGMVMPLKALEWVAEAWEQVAKA